MPPKPFDNHRISADDFLSPEQLFDSGFWKDHSKWPHDPPGYVFLARAFDEIAQAKYGNGWKKSVDGIPEPEMPAADCLDEAVWEAYDLADDQYEEACDRAEALVRERQMSVARVIAENCEDGTLVTALRAKPGGEMMRLESHFWNIENHLMRFFRCDMSTDRPFAVPRTGDQTHWIFVSRSSLDQFLAGRISMTPSVQERGTPDDGPAANAATDTPPAPLQTLAVTRAHRLSATAEAIVELWGKNGPPPGLMEAERNHKVNEWLIKRDKKRVSPATIRRALRSTRIGS